MLLICLALVALFMWLDSECARRAALRGTIEQYKRDRRGRR